MELLILSNIALWVLVVILAITVLALARQIGVLYERVAPMGALVMDTGPKVGEAVPAMALPTLDGDTMALGAPRARALLIFFLSPTCPVCKKLLPVLRSLATAEADWLDIALASDGEQAEHAAFHAREKLAPFPYILSQELGMRFRITKLPYALLVGTDGAVAAKGLVNSREQLESLLVAKEMQVASVQEFIARRRAAQEA